MDGGLVQNVPIEALQTAGAGVTIASHLNSVSHYQEISHVLDVMRNAFEIAVSQHTQDQLKEADLLISMDLSDFSLRDNTERYDELFNIGHQAATVQLTKLVWYKKTNLFLYIGRMMRELAPFKLPEFIRRALNKTGV